MRKHPILRKRMERKATHFSVKNLTEKPYKHGSRMLIVSHRPDEIRRGHRGQHSPHSDSTLERSG